MPSYIYMESWIMSNGREEWNLKNQHRPSSILNSVFFHFRMQNSNIFLSGSWLKVKSWILHAQPYFWNPFLPEQTVFNQAILFGEARIGKCQKDPPPYLVCLNGHRPKSRDESPSCINSIFWRLFSQSNLFHFLLLHGSDSKIFFIRHNSAHNYDSIAFQNRYSCHVNFYARNALGTNNSSIRMWKIHLAMCFRCNTSLLTYSCSGHLHICNAFQFVANWLKFQYHLNTTAKSNRRFDNSSKQLDTVTLWGLSLWTWFVRNLCYHFWKITWFILHYQTCVMISDFRVNPHLHLRFF